MKSITSASFNAYLLSDSLSIVACYLLSMPPQHEWWQNNHFVDHPQYKDKELCSFSSHDGK
jgi:hypothetical protein